MCRICDQLHGTCQSESCGYQYAAYPDDLFWRQHDPCHADVKCCGYDFCMDSHRNNRCYWFRCKWYRNYSCSDNQHDRNHPGHGYLCHYSKCFRMSGICDQLHGTCQSCAVNPYPNDRLFSWIWECCDYSNKPNRSRYCL